MSDFLTSPHDTVSHVLVTVSFNNAALMNYWCNAETVLVSCSALRALNSTIPLLTWIMWTAKQQL